MSLPQGLWVPRFGSPANTSNTSRNSFSPGITVMKHFRFSHGRSSTDEAGVSLTGLPLSSLNTTSIIPLSIQVFQMCLMLSWSNLPASAWLLNFLHQSSLIKHGTEGAFVEEATVEAGVGAVIVDSKKVDETMTSTQKSASLNTILRTSLFWARRSAASADSTAQCCHWPVTSSQASVWNLFKQGFATTCRVRPLVDSIVTCRHSLELSISKLKPHADCLRFDVERQDQDGLRTADSWQSDQTINRQLSTDGCRLSTAKFPPRCNPCSNMQLKWSRSLLVWICATVVKCWTRPQPTQVRVRNSTSFSFRMPAAEFRVISCVEVRKTLKVLCSCQSRTNHDQVSCFSFHFHVWLELAVLFVQRILVLNHCLCFQHCMNKTGFLCVKLEPKVCPTQFKHLLICLFCAFWFLSLSLFSKFGEQNFCFGVKLEPKVCPTQQHFLICLFCAFWFSIIVSVFKIGGTKLFSFGVKLAPKVCPTYLKCFVNSVFGAFWFPIVVCVPQLEDEDCFHLGLSCCMSMKYQTKLKQFLIISSFCLFSGRALSPWWQLPWRVTWSTASVRRKLAGGSPRLANLAQMMVSWHRYSLNFNCFKQGIVRN